MKGIKMMVIAAILKDILVSIRMVAADVVVHFFTLTISMLSAKKLVFPIVNDRNRTYIKNVPDLSLNVICSACQMDWGKMTYTPQHVANFFLERAEKASSPVTQLKLMKLVYIAYGWVLALTDKKLFEEDIQAWKHGPVIPSIYHEFKHFGSSPISERAIAMDMDTYDSSEPTIARDDRVTVMILDKVWSVYKDFSGWTLVKKTHELGTPWHEVFRPGEMEIQIPDGKIKKHYQERIKTYLDAAA